MNPISKRILSILLVAVMCLTMLPGTAFAAEGDPCKNKATWGCTGTYTAAGYCNVCSKNEDGGTCAHELTSFQGSGYVCPECEKFFDTCPHFGYDIHTNKCYICGDCKYVFTENCPTGTRYTSNGSYTHTVTVMCSVCVGVLSKTEEDHTILSEATCLKKAVCEQCGEFGSENKANHVNPTPTYTESAANNILHEIRYECCGTVTTEEHTDEDGDSACDACGSTNFHEHNFVYTYRGKRPILGEPAKSHYVNKSCTGCDTTFEEIVESCSIDTNCLGKCTKCGNMTTDKNPNVHASTEITYTDNGNGTHTGKYACCGAEYVTNEDHSYNDDGECVCGAVSETISATITWGAMSFTYTDGEWDPETHTYGEGKWTPDDENGNVITVKNNSNAAVNVTFTYTKTVAEVEGSFTDESGSAIPSPFALVPEEEKKIKLILNGKPSSTLDAQTLGTVTVSITLPKE